VWIATRKKNFYAAIEKFNFDWFGFGEVLNGCPFKPSQAVPPVTISCDY
jgi:hypothetical protein